MFRPMPTREEDVRPGYRLEYPNREKASSKTVKAVVVLLTIVAAVLMAIVTIGGWEKLQGMKAIQVAFIIIFLIVAFFIARWRSGMLPVIAAMAMILLIFAAVSAPQWFARDKDGFDDPALASEILGMITMIIIPVALLLIGFAMAGFRQNWQVEVEKKIEDDGPPEDYDADRRRGRDPSPQPA